LVTFDYVEDVHWAEL